MSKTFGESWIGGGVEVASGSRYFEPFVLRNLAVHCSSCSSCSGRHQKFTKIKIAAFLLDLLWIHKKIFQPSGQEVVKDLFWYFLIGPLWPQKKGFRWEGGSSPKTGRQWQSNFVLFRPKSNSLQRVCVRGTIRSNRNWIWALSNYVLVEMCTELLWCHRCLVPT